MKRNDSYFEMIQGNVDEYITERLKQFLKDNPKIEKLSETIINEDK